MEVKKCVKCEREKELSEFRLNREWYQNTCKKCEYKSNQEWKKLNREKVLGHNRKHYLKCRRPLVLTYGKKDLSEFPKRQCKCGCGDFVAPKEGILKKTDSRTVYFPKYIEGHKKHPNCLVCGKPNPAKKVKFCSTLCKNRHRLKLEKSNGKYEKWLKNVLDSHHYFKTQFINRTNLSADDIPTELLEAYKQYILLKREVKNGTARSI